MLLAVEKCESFQKRVTTSIFENNQTSITFIPKRWSVFIHKEHLRPSSSSLKPPLSVQNRSFCSNEIAYCALVELSCQTMSLFTSRYLERESFRDCGPYWERKWGKKKERKRFSCCCLHQGKIRSLPKDTTARDWVKIWQLFFYYESVVASSGFGDYNKRFSRLVRIKYF